MIRKLLLIRKNDMNSTLIEELGLKTLVKGEPLSVFPVAWSEEDGITHYGFDLEMKFKEFLQLKAIMDQNDNYTMLDNKDGNVDKALQTVGLRVHPSDE